jgi:hypothetical protein
MKRIEFIKLSALSSLLVPTVLKGKNHFLNAKQETSTPNTIFCSACGTAFVDEKFTSGNCPVCSDDRQYIPSKGQSWTKREDLQNNFNNLITPIADNFYEIKTIPKFAIGQRAFLITSPNGNILWDCMPLLKDNTVEFIKSKGGLKAIAISHPHYYSSMNEWAETFNCPIYIHQSDEEFIFTKGSHINLWNGDENELWDSIKIKNIGGHFPGSSILIVPFLSKEGTILCGDTFYISPSKRHISVMYSYPNLIPVSLSEINRINGIMKNVPFDTIIGGFDNQKISPNAKDILNASFAKYL